MISLPFGVASARKVAGSIVSRKNKAWPSAITQMTSPSGKDPNDLMGALRAADSENVYLLILYGKFLHVFAENLSFGSEKKFKLWLEQGGTCGGAK